MEVDRNARRDRWGSLCLAVMTVLLCVAFVAVDAIHQKAEPITAGDNDWGGKALVFVALTAITFFVAAIAGIRCFVLHRDFWPLLWLIRLVLGLYIFLEFFDWPSIILYRVR